MQRLGVHFDVYSGESFHQDQAQEVVRQLRSHGLLRTSEYVCLPSAFFLNKLMKSLWRAELSPNIRLCLQEGNTSGGPLSSRRLEQLLHGSPQRRHEPLHHQVAVSAIGPFQILNLLKMKQTNSNWGLLTLKLSGFPSHRDLAAAVDRMQEYNFDEMIYVVRQQSILLIVLANVLGSKKHIITLTSMCDNGMGADVGASLSGLRPFSCSCLCSCQKTDFSASISSVH